MRLLIFVLKSFANNNRDCARSDGMFLSSGEKKYTNAWIRDGTSFFNEANYISWQKQDSEYHTWGLSIGFPIGKGY